MSMTTKLGELVGQVKDNRVRLAQHRSKMEVKVAKILDSKAKDRVKKAKLMEMLVVLVNNKSSYSEHDYNTLIEAKESL